MTINMKHMPSMFRDDLVTIGVTFDQANIGSVQYLRGDLGNHVKIGGSKVYTYKALQDHDIKAGDLVAVPTVNGEIKIVSVVIVHDAPQIDVESSIDYKWIIQKIDSAWYDTINKREQEFMNVLRDMERQKAREEVRNGFLNSLPVDSPLRGVLEGAVKSLNSKIIDNDPVSE